MVEMKELLERTVAEGASDLHICVGCPPTIRLHGGLIPLEGPPLGPVDTERLVKGVTSDQNQEKLRTKGGADFGFSFGDQARFRVSVYKQKGSMAMALRLIPNRLLTLEEIGLPAMIKTLLYKPRGLILVTGPTGSGKTTTLASMLNVINQERDCHILTIEDPIEYFFTPKKALINQRELLSDTLSYSNALRSVLREDPDVVLVGEMRDQETVEATLRVAETGHLTFSTLHTNSAPETISRIIDIFPPQYQAQARVMLSMSLEGVMCQSLLPRADGTGRVLAMEILIPNPAVRNLIRENKIHQIYSQMQLGQEKFGMLTFNQNLCDLHCRKVITLETAMSATSNPEELTDLIQRRAAGVGVAVKR